MMSTCVKQNLLLSVYPDGPNSIILALNHSDCSYFVGCRRVQLFDFCSPRNELWVNFSNFQPVRTSGLCRSRKKGRAITMSPYGACTFPDRIKSLHSFDTVKEDRLILSNIDFLNIYLKRELVLFVDFLLSKTLPFMNISMQFAQSPKDVVSITVQSGSVKQLCCCSSPCEMPPSLSIVDAVMEDSNCDDVEVFSSGDELDKFESDTDSQDTVIEGEAYKRMRSVAIKEKILHANEELFGQFHGNKNLLGNLARWCNLNRSDQYSSDTSNFLLEESLSYSSFDKKPSIEVKNVFQCRNELSELEPLKSNNVVAFNSSFHQISELGYPRYVIPSTVVLALEESPNTSESSDNGSDTEEVALSDTSSSSDEVSYISSPVIPFHYNQPISYKLHTIAEENCEEHEKNSRAHALTNRGFSFSHLRQNNIFTKTMYSGTKAFPNRSCHKLKPSRVSHGHLPNAKSIRNVPARPSHSFVSRKGPHAGESLSTAWLENYFEHGLLANRIPNFDDDLTDESGGLSSDDDRDSDFCENNSKGLKNIKNGKKIQIQCDEVLMKKNKSQLQELKIYNNLKSSVGSNVLGKLDEYFPQKENFFSECCSAVESVSDDEARYIMNHVIQHITNKNDVTVEQVQSDSQKSSTLQMLESKITCLMMTVSPVPLSTGEPSSSCSSTIGSNNSDYGSDTLESCDDTTTDEESIENLSRGHVSPLNKNTGKEILHLNVENESHLSSCYDFSAAIGTASSENVTPDETLYICKQVVASLKKIADSTDANMVSDELSKAVDDNTAKQYIADQIVSLMQTVNASQNNSPLVNRFSPSTLASLNADVLNGLDRSDSDSPQPNEYKRCFLKSKTPSESGSETTISASISIPSYDDSDRTPTESEISHEMDELYALLESNGTEASNLNRSSAEYSDVQGSDYTPATINLECSLLFGAASKLESLLPIPVEERIAMYNNALICKERDDFKQNGMRINVVLPHIPPETDVLSAFEPVQKRCSDPSQKINDKHESLETIFLKNETNNSEGSGVTSVKIEHDSSYNSERMFHCVPEEASLISLDVNLNAQSDDLCDLTADCSVLSFNSVQSGTEGSGIVPCLPKVINPKEKASSENDLLIANYRAKSKNKVFGTKSTGNISELENVSNKSNFRDTGYYSFKSSDESFLSLDDSTNSRTSTTSLTQYRSLTSTETIPEEEETSYKAASPTKISLSSGNIPFEVCDTSSSKSSTLPPNLRGGKLSVAGHRSRSSFFSTSGVLRKLTLLRDESGNSLRSSPHGRMRIRHRTLSGGSEDGRHLKEPISHMTATTCQQLKQVGSLCVGLAKDTSYLPDDDVEQVLSHHSRSQMSLSSFGGRSGSVTSVYSAAGGGRYGTVNVTGDVCFSMNYNFKNGMFEVLIKACRNLAAVDIKRSRSDPYVKVYLLPDRTKSGKRKTKVKKHTLNPMFEELLKFQVTLSELEKRTLWLSVWHSDRFGRNDFLGEVVLPLEHDSFEKAELNWYPLQERFEAMDAPVSYKGDLILALKYVPPDFNNQKKQLKGSLYVLVKEARNLMATRSNGTSDPFCKSYLLPDKSKSGKQKTPVLKKTCNPKWNHTFIYENVSLEELKSRCLELTVWDYDKITSNDFLGGVRLCLGTGKCMDNDVDWMDSVGEEVSLWYTMLDRPNMWVDGSLLLRSSMRNRGTM